MKGKFQSKSVSVSALIHSKMIFDVSVGCSGALGHMGSSPHVTDCRTGTSCGRSLNVHHFTQKRLWSAGYHSVKRLPQSRKRENGRTASFSSLCPK